MHKHLIKCLYRSLAILITFTTLTTSSVAFDGPETSPEKEKELIGLLRSDAALSEKALACKNLAIHGSAAAVPELAKLLPNPQLSSWARIALEAIPGDASDEALRKAADTLEGRLLIGTINSIGFRQDAKAVQSLTKKLAHADAEVASAAAVALGHIGDVAAMKALRESLEPAPPKVRSAIAEGCILIAERLYTDGKLEAATEIYDEIRTADVPLQRIIEGTRGAILARQQDGTPLLIETFQSENKRLFQLALGTIREFPGAKIDIALANELTQTTPQRAALLVQAMADRPDTVVLAAVLKAAEQGEKTVRLSAIDALTRVGDDTCLETLLTIATDDDDKLATAAKQTLASLSGAKVNEQIVTLLPTAKGKSYILLLQLVGERRIAAVPTVLVALDHKDPAVREAALIALGQTVSLDRLSVLISQVVTPKNADDAPVAQLALKAASVRMPDREACAEQLTLALERAPAATQTTLLEILAEVGGTKALQTLATVAKSDNDGLQDTGSRLLGKWNNVAAAPVLLDLAKTGPAEKYRVRALRGYIGIARKFAMSDEARATMCRNAFDATKRTPERKLVLDVLKLHPSAEGLKLAVDAIKIPELKAEATPVALVIAQKVGGKGTDVSKLLSGVGLDKVKLEITKAEYGAGKNQKDVTAALRKQAGDLPLIALGSANYNASFGGDPAPGVVKRLTIEYRMNGKQGEASFAENELIILPMPK